MTAALLAAPAWPSPADSGAGADAPGVQLSAAWVRAMPPGRPMTAAYLTVHNRSAGTVSIRSVSSPAGEASLHETRIDAGRSSMHAVDELRIPAEGSLSLSPGGLHIMLMGLAETPVVGAAIRLCLRGSHGESCVDAPVRRGPPDAVDGGDEGMQHDDHGHHHRHGGEATDER